MSEMTGSESEATRNGSESARIEGGIACEGSEGGESGETSRNRVRIAAFDFDGTCISGNSPVLLVHYLAARGMLSLRTTLGIINWSMRYEFHLSQDESSARELVFRSFEGMTREYVDRFLAKFYEDKIARRIRKQAVEQIEEHTRRGDCVIIISATFEPILMRAMKDMPFENEISTRMKLDGKGRYLAQVDGLPCEGEEKVAALTRYADERFGAGNWELAYAYGDHHSDRAILDAAEHAVAVTPCATLKSYARRRGYEIVDWR